MYERKQLSVWPMHFAFLMLVMVSVTATTIAIVIEHVLPPHDHVAARPEATLMGNGIWI